MNDLSCELGGALGIVVLGTLKSARYRDELDTGGLPGPVAHAARSSLAAADHIGRTTGNTALIERARDAFASGMHLALISGAVTQPGTRSPGHGTGDGVAAADRRTHPPRRTARETTIRPARRTGKGTDMTPLHGRREGHDGRDRHDKTAHQPGPERLPESLQALTRPLALLGTRGIGLIFTALAAGPADIHLTHERVPGTPRPAVYTFAPTARRSSFPRPL
ncbi:hypothetical protein [Streptomyces sp. VNUA24]|uniref:hypothetical protein n=1 Tax=Streptomyces sp. VNUA24 TaxID=3031131 RepID=UPI0023B7BC9F|nr:hypothetical protein [Streptomyces sp. VNUA24]WEH12433.1 hypothetical protein PYR72_01485 [Streptomyces sp. VNUA24]